MSQQTSAADEAVTEWEFDLGETVVLLWMVNAEGLIIGRSEFLRQDDQYLVEYPDINGRICRTWLSGDAIDRKGVQ